MNGERPQRAYVYPTEFRPTKRRPYPKDAWAAFCPGHVRLLAVTEHRRSAEDVVDRHNSCHHPAEESNDYSS